MSLPTVAADRKATPITTGVLDYFPDAIAEVARVSKAGNEQHNPGQPLHWAKDKSTDHADCIARHLLERGTIDADGQRHSAKIAWRALALLQIELEAAAKPAEPEVVKTRVTKAGILSVYQILNSTLSPEDTTPERFSLWKYAVNNREEFLTVLVPLASKCGNQGVEIENFSVDSTSVELAAENVPLVSPFKKADIRVEEGEATEAYVDQDKEPVVDRGNWPDSPGVWRWGGYSCYEYTNYGDKFDQHGFPILTITKDTIKSEELGTTFRPQWLDGVPSGPGFDKDGNKYFIVKDALWVKVRELKNRSSDEVFKLFGKVTKHENDDSSVASRIRDGVTGDHRQISQEGDLSWAELNRLYDIYTIYLGKKKKK